MHEEDCIKSIQGNTNKINKYLINHAFGSDEIRYLVSPRTLTGIIVGRIEKMFIASMQLGKNDTKDWATYAWETITSQGQRVLKNNKEIKDKKEGIIFLTEKAEDFKKKEFPF